MCRSQPFDPRLTAVKYCQNFTLVCVLLFPWTATGPASPAHAQDRHLSADFSEVYRIGGLGAPSWALFSTPGPMGFDASGNLYVLDRQASQVVVIGVDGRLIMSTGRRGEGPGEFQIPYDLLVWRDGRFVVPDLGHAAYQAFSSDGRLEGFVRMDKQPNPLEAAGYLGRVIRPGPQGTTLYAQGMLNAVRHLLGSEVRELLGMAEAATEVDERGIERIDLSGEVAEARTVLKAWRPPRDEPSEEVTVRDLADPSTLVEAFGGSRYYEPRLHWDILPDGTVAYSDSSAYLIRFAAAGGRTTSELTRPILPEPVSRRLRSRTIEREIRKQESEQVDDEPSVMDAMLRGYLRGLSDARREQIERRPFSDEVPVIRDIRATWEGVLWVQRRGEEAWDDEGPIDVFGLDRRYLGTFAAGDTKMPDAFGPEGLVGFWALDELDVPIIVVRRLPDSFR